MLNSEILEVTPLSFSDYSRFLKTSGGGRYARMRCNALPWELLKLVHISALHGMQTLEPGRYYPSKEVCHPAIWAGLSKYERICAGIGLVFLVREGLVPLSMKARESSKWQKFYQLL